MTFKVTTGVAYIMVVVALVVGAWHMQTSNDHAKKALCAVALHDHQMWSGLASYIVVQTGRNPNHTEAQLKGASDFGGFINKLNGPEISC